MSYQRWDIFIVQHSHIDLGFTDRQEVIADYHYQFIDQAVTMALDPKQDARHPDARFKFTCEGFWQVEQFLARAGERGLNDFVRAVRSGAIELTAFYLHLTELLDAAHLKNTVTRASSFARRNQLPMTAAMSCDVNGFSSAIVDALADSGVKYLSTNINSHHGGFPLGGPLKPFYWEGPSGGRILVWSGLPYHKANLLGLMGGWSPGDNPGIPGVALASGGYVDVHDISYAEKRLLPTLEGLASGGYPYRFLPLMGSGLYTDNSPPTDAYCDIIQAWNNKHGDRVHIRTATLTEFFQYLEANVQDIPTYRGEWTDWWSDGVASAPQDTILFRNAQRNKRLIDTLDQDAGVVSLESRSAIERSLTLYAEHTFGYSDTHNPSLLSQQVFMRKTKLAVEADELASTALDSVLRSRGAGRFTARRGFDYKVINPLAVSRKGVAHLPIDWWETGALSQPFEVVAKGVSVPYQLARDSRGLRIAVIVDAEGSEEVEVKVEPGGNEGSGPKADSKADSFENEFYRLAWSDDTGINSLVDLGTKTEVVSPGLSSAIGQPLYQIFPGANRGDTAGFGLAPRRIPTGEIHAGICRGCTVTESGPVFTTLRVNYEIPGADGYHVIARMYRDLPQIEISVRLNKHNIIDPEGLYAAFPLAVEDGVWHLDKPGGPIRPGIDQIPGTCCDYYCVQDGAAYVGAALGISLTTLDAPLVHIGDLRLWQYNTSIEPTGPIYSWLTNNKWETNFRIYTGGQYEFRYLLQLGSALADPAKAVGQVRSNAVPLVTIRTS